MQTPQVYLGGFKTVAFDFGQIHMRGGCLGKAAPMVSKTIPMKLSSANRGDGASKVPQSKTFVKMSMTEKWLLFVARLSLLWRRPHLLLPPPPFVSAPGLSNRMCSIGCLIFCGIGFPAY